MFSSIGPAQLLIILLIILVVFGSKRLQSLGSDVGTCIRGFRHSIADTATNPEEEERRID